MNGQIVELEERPRVIQDVKDDNLNELLSSLAHRGAWVLSMERRGAVYSLQVSWRDQGKSHACLVTFRPLHFARERKRSG